MGDVYRVRCPNCGYASGELLGVAGQWGLAGVKIETVSCPAVAGLIDIALGSVYEQRRWPLPPVEEVPCPECGRFHRAWNPVEASCPRCGERCEVERTGEWE